MDEATVTISAREYHDLMCKADFNNYVFEKVDNLQRDFHFLNDDVRRLEAKVNELEQRKRG